MTCVDANVLLEVIQQRSHAQVCEQFLGNADDKAISTLTLDLVMYFVERDKLALEPVKEFLQSFSWLPMVDADAQWAFMHFQGKDFEDALQVACALRENCSGFATLDGLLAKKYKQDITIQLLR